MGPKWEKDQETRVVCFLLFTRYYFGDESVDDEMDKSCST